MKPPTSDHFSAILQQILKLMGRIKNWLRKINNHSSMIQSRFSNLAIIHIENKLVKTSIESKQILGEFVKCGPRRIIKLTLKQFNTKVIYGS